MFQSFFGSLLNYRYGNENVSLRHLSWICITSILTTSYWLKNCSVYGRSCRIYSPKSFGFFQKEFRKVSKNKYVIHRLRVGRYGEKLWPRSWKCGLGQYFEDRGHSFSPYGPLSRQITYIYSSSYSWFSNSYYFDHTPSADC